MEENMNYSKKIVKTHKNESTYETSEGIKLSCSKSCRKCQIKLRLHNCVSGPLGTLYLDLWQLACFLSGNSAQN